MNHYHYFPLCHMNIRQCHRSQKLYQSPYNTNIHWSNSCYQSLSTQMNKLLWLSIIVINHYSMRWTRCYMVIGRYHVTWALPFVKCSVDVTNANAKDSTENERVKISKYIHSLKVEISDTCILNSFLINWSCLQFVCISRKYM